VASVSADVTICQGESTQLLAQSQEGIYYKWVPSTGLNRDDIANPVATPSETTTYNVLVSNNGCHDYTKSVTVTVLKNPVADAGADKKIFEGQSTTLPGKLTGDNIVDYYWTPTDNLDDPKSLTPVATPADNITYTLHVISGSCGLSTDDIFVRVYKKLTIPNTFSPNADGINDYWNVKNLFTYPECTVSIFNRYGNQVFKSRGYSKPWDGTNNGTSVPVGTYYYIIDLNIGTPKLSGWLLVVR
jgi:gliding motility-associated-like protein